MKLLAVSPMNELTVTLTPGQIITWILGICAGITCIAGAIGVIVKAVRAAKAPNKKQDDRISELEEKSRAYEGYFDHDKRRLEALEEGNRVTQRAILALLAHGIDGNAIDAMKAAKDELHNYLIKR